MRRSVSMSRPCGRFAVGRYPSLDTDTELRRIQRPSKKIEKEDRKTSKPWVTGGLDIEVATDKQGSTLVRWAAVEACQRTRAGTKLAADRARIIAARGRNIGVVPRPASCSPTSTTACATAKSGRWPKGPRERVRTQQDA